MPISLAVAIFNNIGLPEECTEVSVQEKMQAVEVLLSMNPADTKKFVPKVAILNALRFMYERWRTVS